MPDQFECNSLIEVGDEIFIRRGPFGGGNSKCGNTLVKYKKKNWEYKKLSDLCSPGKPIFQMTRKSAKKNNTGSGGNQIV